MYQRFMAQKQINASFQKQILTDLKQKILVGQLDIGESVSTGGFSLLSMFNRPETVETEETTVEPMETVPVKRSSQAMPQINTLNFSSERKAEKKFNFFQTYDLKKFIVDKEKVREEREKLKEKAAKDYLNIAKKARKTRNYETLSRTERILNWF